MKTSKIVIYPGARPMQAESSEARLVSSAELKGWLRRGAFLKHLFRYQEAEWRMENFPVLPHPAMAALLLRLLSRGKCCFRDSRGCEKPLTYAALTGLVYQCVKDYLRRPALLRSIEQEVTDWKKEKVCKPLDLTGTPVYLRTYLWFGLASGGSIGHIAGVANTMDKFCAPPLLLTTHPIPTVRPDVETVLITPPPEFWDFDEMPDFNLTAPYYRRVAEILESRQIGFLYQRYSLNHYAGVKLAQRYRVPLVLEYNSSGIWVSRNWSKPLKYESLSAKIEMLNLCAADLIVVVSKTLKDDLIGRGIEANKILVNPNGVDTACYTPDIEGAEIRELFNLRGKIAVGFIGTFGAWHGAEKLAEAFGMLLQKYPELRKKARLLMIGDGPKRGETEAQLQKYNVKNEAILTGLVPQALGPSYLAACDILVSPQIPNADGTPFFGSPTKLFEYMAMGKGIVASNLNQIGEVLEHGGTGFLVKPGDAADLMCGLKVLIEDAELRAQLGAAARRQAVAHHTWEAHTGRIIAALKERCA